MNNDKLPSPSTAAKRIYLSNEFSYAFVLSRLEWCTKDAKASSKASSVDDYVVLHELFFMLDDVTEQVGFTYEYFVEVAEFIEILCAQ